MIEDTWSTRDLPVLKVIVELADQGESSVEPAEIQRRTGLSAQQVQVALAALDDEDPSLISIIGHTRGDGTREIYAAQQPTGEARRRVGSWPTPEGLADRLIAALKEAAEAETDPERKTKWETVAGFLSGVGQGVLIGVLTKALTS